MIEEDPEYRLVEDLQNAGLVPVNNNMGRADDNPIIGQRPRGVSESIPQEAIDRALRDDGLQQNHEDVIQPRQRQQKAPRSPEKK